MNSDAMMICLRKFAMPRSRKNQRGFTLIELLTVVVVVGILSSVALPNFLNSTDRTRYAQVSADMGKMKISLKEYYEINASFPGDVNEGQVPVGIASIDWQTRRQLTPTTANAQYDYDSYDSGTGGCYIQIVFRGEDDVRDVPASQVLFAKPGIYRQSNQSAFNMKDDQVLSMGINPGTCRPSGT